MGTHHVQVHLLGGFAVVVDGHGVPEAAWRRRQAASLVGLLALTPGHRLHRERVIAALWPESGLTEATPRLHKAAHFARRALGASDAVVLAGEMVGLFPGERIEVDARSFEEQARAALAALDAGAAAAAIDAFAAGLLPDDLYDAWTEEPRERLRLLRQDLLRLAQRWDELAAADPADEQASVAVARRLAAAGDAPAALRQFERLERALRQELGVGLSPEATRVRAALVDARAAAPPADGDRELLGRDAELAWIRRALSRTREGTGRMLFVSGPPGVGKTSMLSALEEQATAAHMRVGTGLAARIDGAWPYAPVLEALSDLCRRHPALLDRLDDTMREELQRTLAGRSGGWDGQGSHQRLFLSAVELLRLAAAGAGAVLLIDDAHEADGASLRLLHFLSRATLTDRVAVVLAHRPVTTGVLAEVRNGLLGRRSAATLDLGPLRPRAALALARRHAPQAPPAGLEAVAAAAAGMPFAIVQGARALAADPSASPAAALLPPGLPREVTRALATVAVLGSSFDTDEFVELTGLRDEHAYAVLDLALAHRLLRRTEDGFAFGHALQRDALLQRGGGSRQAAHLAAAGALQRLGRPPGRIGRHLVQAGRVAEAVPWVLRAAETQAALGAYREALTTLDAVRDAATGDEGARLLALRADLLGASGDLEALDAYRAALAATSDRPRRARLRTRLAVAAMQRGDLDTAALALGDLEPDGTSNDGDLLVAQGRLAYFRRDIATATAAAEEAQRRLLLSGPVDSRLFELVTLQGQLAHDRGEWFQRLRAELRTGADRPELATALFDSQLCVAEYLLYGPTPYDEVLDLADKLHRTAERAGVPRAVAFAVALRGEAALLKGDLDLAESELADAADLHHALEAPAGEAASLQRLAVVHMHRSDPGAARSLLQRALPLARWSPLGRCLLPRIYGTMIDAADDGEGAVAIVDRADAALAPEDLCSFCTVMLAVPAARACAVAGDLDRARRWFATAQAVDTRWEGTSFEAALLEVRAAINRAEGDEPEAQQLLEAAADLFDRFGQPLDAARCRAAVSHAEVPSPRPPDSLPAAAVR